MPQKDILNVSVTNRNQVLNDVTVNGYDLRHVSPELRNDREIVLATVNNYGYALLFTFSDLRRDREIVIIKRYIK